jgi:hypothetical protein
MLVLYPQRFRRVNLFSTFFLVVRLVPTNG